MKRKMIIPTIALVAILGAVSIGTMPVSAQSNVYGNLVSKIAQRFNLKESDVQEVIDQVRVDRMNQMKANWETKLSQLVSDGKLTQSQKDELVKKHSELQNKITSLKGLSPEEKKTKMKQIFDDFSKWANDKNINLKEVGMFGFKGSFGRGFHFGYRAGKG